VTPSPNLENPFPGAGQQLQCHVFLLDRAGNSYAPGKNEGPLTNHFYSSDSGI
jgi:hypothetical protein